MYLAGDGFSRIDSLNSLKDLKPQKERFDYIITNIPFGKGDFCVYPSIIANKRKEINFLIKVVQLLKPHGKGLVVVPDGVLEAPTLAPLRKWVIENCLLEKIIGLPKHMFAPYTHEKTYVLFLRKRPTPILNLDEIKTERVWMYIVDTDGYANSDKRFRTGQKAENGIWKHDELSLWRDTKGAFHVSRIEESWKKKLPDDYEKSVDEWDCEIKGKKYGYLDMATVFSEKRPSYRAISYSKVLERLRKKAQSIPLKNIAELFEDEKQETEPPLRTLKPEYEEILESEKIIYEPFDDRFYDENTVTVELLLNLLPEKYLRPQKTETISFDDFLIENKSVIENLKQDVKSIVTQIERFEQN